MTGNPPNESPTSGPSRPDDDWDALARYFAGECAEPEATAIREWLAANPAEAARYAAIESAVRGISSELRANVDVEAALRSVTARLDQNPRVVAGSSQHRVAPKRLSTSRSPGPWTRRAPLLAAAAIGTIALGTLVWRGRGTPSPAPTEVAPRAVMTGVGQRDSIRLADGSRVLLGPMSHLTIQPGYSAGDRVVELRGEALFDVVHDATHPFVVRAGTATIRDIGTTFAIKATDSTEVRVVVTSGSVQLASTTDAQGVLLKAGDVGTLRAGQAPTARAQTATEEDIAWTKGRLSFRNAPLTTVRDELRRWYGIQLVLADSSLQRRTLNTTFVRESPEQAVRIIEMTLGVRIEMRGDTAIVHGMTGSPRR
jgi:transmembrane sensor